MTAPIIPQEIYLLERYSSAKYFGEMRDAWASMLDAAEQALKKFMVALPKNYRSLPLPEQPDIVWGERVLPIFRSTLESLNEGYIRRSRGDWSAIGLCGNVKSDIRGKTSDYPSDWMGQELDDAFDKAQVIASLHASQMMSTWLVQWCVGDLSSNFDPQNFGELNAPAFWPTYGIDPSIQVKTGALVPKSGVYIPSHDNSCAAVLIQGEAAHPCNLGYDPQTTHASVQEATVWTLVVRVSDSGGEATHDAAKHSRAWLQLRCEAGQKCPRSGYWFTPARLNSRRRFSVGEQMPDVGGAYGATIWQWDEVQD